jgi:monofunctional biosynthetic peptidoglycan transglycosylase
MKRTGKKNWWQKVKRVLLWLLILQFIYIIILRWINPPFTITQVVSLLKGNGLRRDYVSYDYMNGFDVKAIKLAVKYNKKHPTKIRGASTISQQVAKNIFLWQGGGIFRKGLEAYFTFMIETFWGKKRILEMYLNVAEMGEGIFGIQVAAKNYFNKNSAELTNIEAAQIAAALPNPIRFTVKPLSNYVAARAGIIVRQMSNLGTDPDVNQLLK